MELFSVLAACAALTVGNGDAPAPAHITQQDCQVAAQTYKESLKAVELSERDRDAVARVTYAEAANQGDSGLAAVVYTIINRLISGRFGGTVSEVVNAPRQFEPVTKAGGKWENLPPVSVAQSSRVETIINLALDGHLPDLTNGALFFQNPVIVGQREKAGQVSRGLTNFGGSQPSAIIKDHAFYASIGQPGAATKSEPVTLSANLKKPKSWDVYGNSKLAKNKHTSSWNVFSSSDQSPANVYAVNDEDGKP